MSLIRNRLPCAVWKCRSFFWTRRRWSRGWLVIVNTSTITNEITTRIICLPAIAMCLKLDIVLININFSLSVYCDSWFCYVRIFKKIFWIVILLWKYMCLSNIDMPLNLRFIEDREYQANLRLIIFRFYSTQYLLVLLYMKGQMPPLF